jgi:AAA+ ATPase superfamily predicted ATPase
LSKLLKEPCRFVDRENELRALEAAYTRRPSFTVIYGRRRIGKSRLISEWLKTIKARKLYYTAHLSSHTHNLENMASKAADQTGDPIFSQVKPRSLETLLNLLSRAGVEVVVIDEFTYWVKSSPQVLSELQSYIDETLPETRMHIVITGSLIGVIEKSILGGGSPLYARADTRLKLGEIDYWHTGNLHPRMNPVDRVRTYALIGGIPYYHCMTTNTRNIDQVITELITRPGAPLVDEKDLILREELRDPHAYNAILSAIAKGYRKPWEIAQVAGVDPSHTRKYLNVLQHLNIVKRITPVFQKKGYYKISDPVIRTWYTLIEPNLELLNLGEYTEAHKQIKKQIDTLTSQAWEEIASRYLHKKHAPQGYTISGPLIHKGIEIDNILINPTERKAIPIEAKWSQLTLKQAQRIRMETESKARKILPPDYQITQTIIAAKQVKPQETPSWIITPQTIETNPP